MKFFTVKKSSLLKVLFFVNFLSVNIFFIFPQDKAETKETAQTEIQNNSQNCSLIDFLLEVVKFNLNGTNKIYIPENHEELSKNASLLLTRTFWKNCRPFFLYQSLFSKSELKKDSSSEEEFDDGSLSLLELLDNRDESAAQDTEVEKTVLNRVHDGSLRKFSCNGEKFTLNTNGELTFLTNVSEKLIVRRTFDRNFSILKREDFKNSQTLSSIVLIKQTDYEYSAGSGKLFKSEFENFENKTKTIKTYFESGKVLCEQKFHYEEEIQQNQNTKTESKNTPDKNTSDEEKKYILVKDSQKSFEYDEEGRLQKTDFIQYFYSTDSKGKKQVSEKQEVTRYEQNEYGTTDEYFEENCELRIKTVYKNSTDYTKTFYFDNGFSVVNEFVNGIKTSEVTKMNGRIMRRRTF